jgi:hypothetical protein
MDFEDFVALIEVYAALPVADQERILLSFLDNLEG